jgi:hypothetical protein
MLLLHNRMKADPSFFPAPPTRFEFPPGSTWLIFTDAIPHAVCEGRFALEQTVIISREALLLPEKAPAAMLERLVATA